ncbi:conserved protein of unknown function [Rhodovastum atsumiense]|uniref:Uncharacterized protein n=1 Tax=Rhodovastum atsumiense TaxID=504468 RepID=A0A5M6IYG2_9PROT|nr:hypothetical protein [Rhodovastum atsumiense]KAA5613384.1 hypothetical protein F1189_04805 [Rhodovastum atsumiense]CAH2603069.1 conserved protein of unknown function [Rhodovastum atsumiense]
MSIDAGLAVADRWFIGLFEHKTLRKIEQAFENLSPELWHVAGHLMVGGQTINHRDETVGGIIDAAERSAHQASASFRWFLLKAALRSMAQAAAASLRETSRLGRAALKGKLEMAREGQAPAEIVLKCIDSRYATGADGQQIGGGLEGRVAGNLFTASDDPGRLGEATKQAIRVGLVKHVPSLRVADHFHCSAKTTIYRSCRQTDRRALDNMSSLELEDYWFARQQEYLVHTVELRTRGVGFDAYEQFGLRLTGDHASKTIDAMACEQGLSLAKMVTAYVATHEAALGTQRPDVRFSLFDPRQHRHHLFDPSRGTQGEFVSLPNVTLWTPSYFSVVTRIMGQNNLSDSAVAPYPRRFPALDAPRREARRRAGGAWPAAWPSGAQPCFCGMHRASTLQSDWLENRDRLQCE